MLGRAEFRPKGFSLTDRGFAGIRRARWGAVCALALMCVWVPAGRARQQDSTADPAAPRLPPRTTSQNRIASLQLAAGAKQHDSHGVHRNAFLAKEKVSAHARAAEDRLRSGAIDSGGTDPRTLHERRSDRHLEPGQRRRHAQIPGGSRLAEQDCPRLARPDQAGTGPEQRPPAESRERHDHRAGCPASRVDAHNLAHFIADVGSRASRES